MALFSAVYIDDTIGTVPRTVLPLKTNANPMFLSLLLESICVHSLTLLVFSHVQEVVFSFLDLLIHFWPLTQAVHINFIQVT